MTKTREEQKYEEGMEALRKQFRQQEETSRIQQETLKFQEKYGRPDKTCKACENCEECLVPILEDITGVVLKKNGSGFNWHIKWKLPKKNKIQGYIIQHVFLEVKAIIQSKFEVDNEDQPFKRVIIAGAKKDREYIILPPQKYNFHEIWPVEGGKDAPEEVLDADLNIMYHDNFHYNADLSGAPDFDLFRFEIKIESFAKFCPCILSREDLGFFPPHLTGHVSPSGKLWSTAGGVKTINECWDIEPGLSRSLKLIYQMDTGWIYKYVKPDEIKFIVE